MPKKSLIVPRYPMRRTGPYFHRWVAACKRLKEDQWQPAAPKSKKRAAKPAPIAIADMHTMQLVNAIKWCVRQADSVLRSTPFTNFGISRAELLAPIPQWRSLLAEARKRKLKIIEGECCSLCHDCNKKCDCLPLAANQCHQWYQDAVKAMVFKDYFD